MTITYSHCDDWMIYGHTPEGRLVYVVTECWPGWLACPPNVEEERGAVEKWMLPIARRSGFDELEWCDAETGARVVDSYVPNYAVGADLPPDPDTEKVYNQVLADAGLTTLEG